MLGESSIGAGMRRIEAVTGRAAEELFVQQFDRLEAISQKLQTPMADLEARLDSFIQETEDLRRQLDGLRKTSLRGEAEELLSKVQDVDGVTVAAGRTSATGAETSMSAPAASAAVFDCPSVASRKADALMRVSRSSASGSDS